ncbi:MAG: ABC transporter permease [Alphaproteobacteria bacterium]
MSFLVRRVLQAAILLLVASVTVFAGVYAVGNPISLLVSPNAPPDVVERTIRHLGLDRSLPEQYLIFLGNVLQGELGTSYVHAQPALELIGHRFPATLELVVAAMAIAVAVGLPLGMLAARGRRSFLSAAISNGSILGLSVPSFWIGLLLIIVFAITWRVFPTGGRGATVDVAGVPVSFLTADGLAHLVLPALTLSSFPMAALVRLTESSIREVRGLDYVRFARALGLPPREIARRYVLRNILVPIVTVMGMMFGSLVAFSVVTETIFAWPGMGKLIMDSIRTSDRPVIVAYILFVVALFVTINALVDLVCALIDPRLRVSRAAA